jgi:MFS family permease
VPDLLHDLNFRRYWLAQTVSFLGDQVTAIALPLAAVLALDASAAQVGFLAAAGSMPNLLLALHAGAFVDRRGRRRETMVLTDLLRAALLISVPVAYFFDALTLIHLYVVAFAAGSLTVVFGVCANSLLPSIVPKDRLMEGNSLSSGTYAVSWIAGPSLGGGLVSLLSAPYALVVDALSFLGSGRLLGSISPDEPPGAAKKRGSIREGLVFLRRTPELFAKLLSYSNLSFFYSMYFTLVFLFATRELGMPAGMIGLAIGGGAVGALLGTAVAARTSKRLGIGTTMVIGTVVYPAALVLVPLCPGAGWVAFGFMVVAEFFSGGALAILDISAVSLQQAMTPDQLRARAQGANMAIAYGARPLGALAAGALASIVAVKSVLLVAVVGGVASVLFLLWSPVRRVRDLPDQVDADVAADAAPAPPDASERDGAAAPADADADADAEQDGRGAR